MDAKIHHIFEKINTQSLEPQDLARVKADVQRECRTFVQYQQTKVERARTLYESVSQQACDLFLTFIL